MGNRNASRRHDYPESTFSVREAIKIAQGPLASAREELQRFDRMVQKVPRQRGAQPRQADGIRDVATGGAELQEYKCLSRSV